MRVISGTARGKRLTPVPGMATRPTTDRVKESMFNIIQYSLCGAKVLDLFAGTGQLGIEALSRGAAYADFIDKDRKAQAVIQKNIKDAHVASHAQVHLIDYQTFLSRNRVCYDIIFLDPPYGGKILQDALKALETFDILAPNGIIICESAADDDWETSFVRGRTYHYGATVLTLLHSAAKENRTDL